MAEAFSLSPLMFAFICSMVFLGGFVDASAGGGSIISLPAYLFTGMPAHFALGCDKLSGGCGTTLSVVKFWKSGAVEVRSAAVAFVASFAGSAIGAQIALALSSDTIKKSLLVVFPCVALIVFFKRDFGEGRESRDISKMRAAIISALVGLLVGGYDGLFGPGTGTFAIIAFSTLLGLDIRTASGNAKILNIASSYASFLTYIYAGTVLYSLAIPAALCNMAGNYIGSRCALAKGARFIRPMMLCVLAMLMIKLLWDVMRA